MSLTLGPIDIFSTGRRPSQTARLLLSSTKIRENFCCTCVLKSKQFYQKWVVLQDRSTPTEMNVSTLLPMLCIPDKITTTSCSKVPQGLHFPMDVRGIFATQYFQKFSTRDSSDLVKPFMHVAIHTTRHYAQSCYIVFSKFLSLHPNLLLEILLSLGFLVD